MPRLELGRGFGRVFRSPTHRTVKLRRGVPCELGSRGSRPAGLIEVLTLANQPDGASGHTVYPARWCRDAVIWPIPVATRSRLSDGRTLAP